jgi:hypothetical protein
MEFENEWEQARDRFINASDFFERTLGGKEEWNTFSQEYLECLKHPQSVCFYTTFIVKATKYSLF